MNTKICKQCGLEKSLDDFAKNVKSKGGYKTLCKLCYNANAREYMQTHETARENRKKYCQDYRKNIRQQVFNHYGQKCACCKEAEPLFLTIDHINNDGAEHRRRIGNNGPRGANTDKVFRWIVQNNFPTDFQILCFNCNCGKQRNGGEFCPHIEEHEGIYATFSDFRPPGF